MSSYAEPLQQWLLPEEQCVQCGESDFLIPLSLWLAALPVLLYVASDAPLPNRSVLRERLAPLVREPMPPRWILARRDERGRWKAVEDGNAKESPSVKRLLVPRGVHWWWLKKEVLPLCGFVEVRCRLILQVCPHLQHLHVLVDMRRYEMLSRVEGFALVPRLRSLRLERARLDAKSDTGGRQFNLLWMVHVLPCLTSLSLVNFGNIRVSELLAFASHSTLEQLHIDTANSTSEHARWIGPDIRFPITTVAEDEQQLAAFRDRHPRLFDGDIEEESDEAGTTTASAATRHQAQQRGSEAEQDEKTEAEQEMEMERWLFEQMHIELTRTQPTTPSCEMRLALADWLHRRLRRGGLRTDDYDDDQRYWRDESRRPKWLLRRYRRQLAVLCSTLQQQLSDLAAASEAVQQSLASRDETVEAALTQSGDGKQASSISEVSSD